MTKPRPDFLRILEVLTAHHVDFIVVGGVSAVLHGAPVATFDLDVVHSRQPKNLHRLLRALEDLGSRYRGVGNRSVKPRLAHLRTSGHQLLMTRAGPLDLLGEIGHGSRYEGLLSETTELEIQKGVKIRVLNLEALIRIKMETARDKDKAVIAVLKQTLKEKMKNGRRKMDPVNGC